MQRKAKNIYAWTGQEQYGPALARLRRCTLKVLPYTSLDRQRRKKGANSSHGALKRLQAAAIAGEKNGHTFLGFEGVGAVVVGHPNATRRGKSLALMAQRFVMIFMRVAMGTGSEVRSGGVGEGGPDSSRIQLPSRGEAKETSKMSTNDLRDCALTLEGAASLFLPGHLVIGNNNQHKNDDASSLKAMKTIIRRLYDIANVLCALGIVDKGVGREAGRDRKPFFRWTDGMPYMDLGKGIGKQVRLIWSYYMHL